MGVHGGLVGARFVPPSATTSSTASATTATSAGDSDANAQQPAKQTMTRTADAPAWPQRSLLCGLARPPSDEQTTAADVQVCGWVDRVRKFGGITFVDVRDGTGLLQVVAEEGETWHERLSTLGREWVVHVSGTLRARKDPNPALPSGYCELADVSSVTVLNLSKEKLPFPVTHSEKETEEPREELRLRHRPLDLRRPEMARNLRLRHDILRRLRGTLDTYHERDGCEAGVAPFVEVETPTLTRATPEGARDYLVPSRVSPGSWFALPQSPQLFKQMLMVGGMERYYQVARCYRDEDLRSDRQPEFTQLDVELSFATQDDVMDVGEALLCATFEAAGREAPPRPFARMTFEQAMERYGSDKPDMRYTGLVSYDVTAAVKGRGFKLFDESKEVRCMVVEEGKSISNSKLKAPKGAVAAEAVAAGAGGLLFTRVCGGGEALEQGPAPAREALEADDGAGLKALLSALGSPADGSLLLFFCGPPAQNSKCVDRVRRYLASSELGLLDGDAASEAAVLWVTDFPLVEYDEELGRSVALHHPFTCPNMDDWATKSSANLEDVRSQAYDLVLNGVEVGGGSIRIHREEMQREMLAALGFTDAEMEEQFGFLLESLRDYGAPPHGGLAMGVDRLVAIMGGCDSIRSVIAFPKTAQASDIFVGAPGPADPKQLTELKLISKHE